MVSSGPFFIWSDPFGSLLVPLGLFRSFWSAQVPFWSVFAQVSGLFRSFLFHSGLLRSFWSFLVLSGLLRSFFWLLFVCSGPFWFGQVPFCPAQVTLLCSLLSCPRLVLDVQGQAEQPLLGLGIVIKSKFRELNSFREGTSHVCENHQGGKNESTGKGLLSPALQTGTGEGLNPKITPNPECQRPGHPTDVKETLQRAKLGLLPSGSA